MYATYQPKGGPFPFSPINLFAAVDRFLEAPPYDPCLLLVSPHIETLHAACHHLCDRFDLPVLSIGDALSTSLMPIPPQKRPRRLRTELRGALTAQTSEAVLCVDVDLLFHPDLQQDPLRLLRNASRVTALFVLWPGNYQDGILTYAVPDHAHFRTWTQPDLCDYCIVNL